MPDFNNELEFANIAEPYNMAAEQAALGAAIQDAETILPDMVLTLKPEMFYAKENGEIFAEMNRMLNEGIPVDAVTLLDAVVMAHIFPSTEAAKAYLMQLSLATPGRENADHHAKIVRDKYTQREIIKTARKMMKQSSDQEDADLVLEGAEQQLMEIRSSQGSNVLKPFAEAVLESINTLEKLGGEDAAKYAGVPTGYKYLDTVLTGLGRSDLVILAARPGMGKTSFALNIATNVAKLKKIPTAVFSLEMSMEQLTNRILSSEAAIDSHAFRTGALTQNDWDDLAHVTDMLHSMPLYMDDSSGITVSEMKAKIKRLNQNPEREPIGLVIIDYLQLMTSGKRTENRVQEISDITRNLKIMAKELDVPVVALSQLSRAAEKSGRADHRPQLSDLRDSGSIEQDADIVLFLYREAYYESISGGDGGSEGGGGGGDVDQRKAECIVAKNRHGETGKVDLWWDGAHTRFIEPETRY